MTQIIQFIITSTYVCTTGYDIFWTVVRSPGVI
jgi:hypothetical protein